MERNNSFMFKTHATLYNRFVVIKQKECKNTKEKHVNWLTVRENLYY